VCDPSLAPCTMALFTVLNLGQSSRQGARPCNELGLRIAKIVNHHKFEVDFKLAFGITV